MIVELCPPPNIHVILMKLCPSEQDLVTNILKYNLINLTWLLITHKDLNIPI